MMADLNRIKTKDPATVSKWCNNHAQPDLKTLAQIAEVLNVDIHELICHTKAEWTEYEIYHRRDTDITPARKGIIDFLLLHPYAGRKEISSNIGSLSEDGVKYNLKVLQQKGIIKRIGPANGGYWKVLSDEAIN